MQTLKCMESREKYESDIWFKISQLPYMVAIGMQGAGNSGIAGSANERYRSLSGILAARTDFPGNPLISSLLPLIEAEDEALIRVMDSHDQILNQLEAAGILTVEDLWTRILELVGEVLPAINKKEAGHTLSDYITWLRQIAVVVANAAKEGDILGLGGTKFSDSEKYYFTKLDKALQEFDE